MIKSSPWAHFGRGHRSLERRGRELGGRGFQSLAKQRAAIKPASQPASQLDNLQPPDFGQTRPSSRKVCALSAQLALLSFEGIFLWPLCRH